MVSAAAVTDLGKNPSVKPWEDKQDSYDEEYEDELPADSTEAATEDA